MSDLTNGLPAGTVISGFEVKRILGHGGFGITYLGHDQTLDMPVAIKEYMPVDFAVRTPEMSVIAKSENLHESFQWGLNSFLEEARTIARFDHPNIVRVRQFFEAHGTAYIVLDHVDGPTLDDVLWDLKRLGPDRLRPILAGLLDGLEVLHGAGVLHRDVKPANIILRPDQAGGEVPVLIDFGAARQLIGAQTRAVTSIVTPGFAPIEQYSVRGNFGPWTDIYAVGAVGYLAASGTKPPDAADRVRRDPLEPLTTETLPDYPPDFIAGLNAAIAFDEEDRPQDIAALRAMIFPDQALPDPNATRVVEPLTKRVDPPTTLLDENQSPAEPTALPPSRRGKGPLFAGLGIVAAGVIGLAVILSGGADPEPSPSPQISDTETPKTEEIAEADLTPTQPSAPTVDPADTLAWQQASVAGTRDALQAYLDAYPDGAHRNEAQQAIIAILNQEAADQSAQALDNLAWAEARGADTPEAYRAYLEAHPDGAHSNAAGVALAALLAERARQEAAERAALEEEAEVAAWQSASSARDPDLVEVFLSRYPDSRFADEAQALLDELRTPANPADDPRVIQCLELALEPVSSNDIPLSEAIPACQLAVEAFPDHSRSLAGLGRSYLKRADQAGLATDYDLSHEAYSRSCSLGYDVGCIGLAFVLRTPESGHRDVDEAARLFEIGCTAGREWANAVSCYELGVLNVNGDLASGQNISAAVDAYEGACRLGESRGCSNAGYYLRRAESGVQNFVLAAELLGRGCDLERGESCYRLALMNRNGELSSGPDVNEAIRLHGLACDYGYAFGCGQGARLLRDRSPADAEAGLELALKGCNMSSGNGRGQSCWFAGDIYRDGNLSGGANHVSAILTFERSCAFDFAAGCNSAGILHRDRLDDFAMASDFFGQGCALADGIDSGRACENLAEMHRVGEVSGQPDLPLASEVFEQACDLGRTNACFDAVLARGDGEATVAEFERFLSLFERGCAHENGSDSGFLCGQLGEALVEGFEGTSIDVPRGLGFLRQGCELGDRSACQRTGHTLLNGPTALRNLSEAAQAYDKACTLGIEVDEFGDCVTYANLLGQGEFGNGSQPAQAVVLFEQACTGGDPFGCKGLFAYAMTGFAPELSPREIAEVYLRQPELGHLSLIFTDLTDVLRPNDPIHRQVIREIQTILKDKRLYGGQIDGVWGPATATAVARLRP